MTKKILLLAAIAATCAQFSFAMKRSVKNAQPQKITIPSEKTLESIFFEHGLDDLVKKTDIMTWLGAGEEKYLVGLWIIKAATLHDYEQHMKDLHDPNISITTIQTNLERAIDEIVKRAKEIELEKVKNKN